MSAREKEARMLERCTEVAWAAEGAVQAAQDGQEANVFRLAAMLMEGRFPEQAGRLMKASEQYFEQKPEEKVASAEIVRRGWIVDAPRLHDRLCRAWKGRGN